MKFLILLFYSCLLFGQSTNIYIFDLSKKDDSFTLTNGTLITDREGYNNQPSFSFDGKTLFFSSDFNANATEIYAYSLENHEEKRLTETLTKEYSPLMMPDGKHISYIKQHGRSQKLMKLNLETLDIEEIKTEEDNVGYHCWLNENVVALFEVPKPFKLAVIDLEEDDREEIVENIGRSLFWNYETQKLNFYRYFNDKAPIICELSDIDDDDFEEIIQMNGKSDDFFVMKDGTFISSAGPLLLKFNPKRDKDWVVLFDGTESGLNELTRVAVNMDMTKIALVTNRNDE